MSDIIVSAQLNKGADIIVRPSGAGTVVIYALDSNLQLSIDPHIAKRLAKEMDEAADEILAGERNE